LDSRWFYDCPFYQFNWCTYKWGLQANLWLIWSASAMIKSKGNIKSISVRLCTPEVIEFHCSHSNRMKANLCSNIYWLFLIAIHRNNKNGMNVPFSLPSRPVFIRPKRLWKTGMKHSNDTVHVARARHRFINFTYNSFQSRFPSTNVLTVFHNKYNFFINYLTLYLTTVNE